MSYSGDPSSSPVDAVRFWAQDAGNPPLLGDPEIQYMIDLQAPLNGAHPVIVAAFCADRIASKYANEVSINADGVSYSGEQLQDKYKAVAESLRKDYDYLKGLSGVPYLGGVRVGDCPAPGTRPLNFGIGMDDNPMAGRQSSNSQWDDYDGYGGY